MASMPSRPSSPRSVAKVGTRLSSRSPLIPPSNNVSNVDPERPILPRHALCDHTQAGFRDGKVRKSGLASQAGGGAFKDNRPRPRGPRPLRLPETELLPTGEVAKLND